MTASTILVVDDDPAITDLLEMALGDQGYEVLTAIDGAALQIAHDRQPNLILLDILMPGMDGVEVSRRLRADTATAHIPIIAMSAQDRLNAMVAQMQVNDSLPKPFAIKSLYNTVARWVPAQ